MLPITVTIPGPVVGKGRPRASHRNGVFRMHEHAKSAAVERSIGQYLALAWRDEPTKDTLALSVEIRVPIPKSFNRTEREAAMASAIFPRSRPDIDNVFKLIADAGNKVVWHDDAQITRLYISRRYASDPGLTVTVEAA